MYNWAKPIMVIVTVVLCGCHGNCKHADVDNRQDAGPKVAIVRHSVPDEVAGSLLGGALSYIEQSDGGDNYYPRAHLASVDYKSKLFIVPNKERIKEMAGTEKHILPGLSPVTEKRLQNIPKLIQQATAYVENAARVLQIVEDSQRSKEKLTKSQIKRLQDEIVTQGKQGEDIVSLVIEIAEFRAGIEHRGDQEAIDQAVEMLTSRLMEDAEGRPVTLNVQELGAFLSEEIDFAMARASEDAEIADKQGIVKFRMRAQLRGQERWVSVRPYFEAGSFNGQKSPRVALSMSAKEQERLKTGFEMATDAAKFIRDARDDESTLRSQLAYLWKTFRSKLQSVSDLLTRDILRDVNNVLVEAVDLALDPNVATAGEVITLNELREFITKEVKTDIQQIMEVSKGLEATSSRDFISKYIMFTQDLDRVLMITSTYPAKTNATIEQLKVLKTVLSKIGTVKSKALLTKLTDEVLPETTRTLKDVLDELMVSYATLATQGKALLMGRQTLAMADGLDTSRERPTVRAVELDDIVPGTIDLNETSADRGDELTVKAELFTTDENGEEDVQQRAATTLRIDRFGITSDYSSHLVFINRLGSGMAADPDTSYDPAPSASWNLQHRIRKTVNEAWYDKCYRFIEPGFGINTAAMDFEDENFQIGVGGHLTLFDNLLILGYGYNLQAATDNDYVYLGIGVLEALDTVGSLFGAASGSLQTHRGLK